MATVAQRAPAQRRRRRSRRRDGSVLGRVLTWLAVVVIVVVTVVPLLYVVLSGFRSTGQLNTDPVGLPDPWVWTNYRDILTSADYWRFLLNSTVIAVIATGLAVGLGAMAADRKSVV